MKSKTRKAAGRASLDPLVRLPKWAQRRIAELEDRVKRAEATLPWTKPGMEWFTLFWPGPEPKSRAPQSLFTCGTGGTCRVCTLGPEDWVFIGRGKKPNAPDQGRLQPSPEAGCSALPTVCPICGVKGRIDSSPVWGNRHICRACKGTFFHGANATEHRT
jgi:hypothetical protein